MELPSKAKVKKTVEEWEEAIWKDLYKDANSLDKKLAIISEELKLQSMPFFKSGVEKFLYLMRLEDIYYEKVFRACHDYGPIF